MENLIDLQNRLAKLKAYMTEDNNNIAPSDMEVLEALKTTAKRNMDEALMDDMEGFVIMYQKRIKLIDEQIEAKCIDQQAEEHKAFSRYEQGMGVD